MAKISERNDYIDDELARELFDVEEGEELPDGRVRVCNGEWVRIPGGYYFDPGAGSLHPEVSGGDVPVETLLRQADNHIQDLRGGVYENGLLGEVRGMGDRLTLPARSITMIEKLVAALASAPPLAVPDAVGVRAIKSLISMVTDYLQPATYVRRFPADATKWATDFEMPHENASEGSKLEAEKRRDRAFILDVICLQDALSSTEPTPSPEPQASNAGAVRDHVTGRYAFSGDMSRRCKCGHTLGVHAHGGFDCLNGEQDAPGSDGAPCKCTKFRPAALSTPEPQTGERDGEAETSIWLGEGWRSEFKIDGMAIAYNRQAYNWFVEFVPATFLTTERQRTAAAYAEADHWKRKYEAERSGHEQTKKHWGVELELSTKLQRRLAEVEERSRLALALVPHLKDELRHVHNPITMNNISYYLQQMEAALLGKEAGE